MNTKMMGWLVLLIGLLGTSVPAFATLDIRAGMGAVASKPQDLQDFQGANAPVLWGSGGLVADLLIRPAPMIGIGVRYENYKASQSTGSGGSQYGFSSEMQRRSVVLSLRPVDSFIYTGAVLTMGFAGNHNLSLQTAGSTTDFSGQMKSSFSVGGEIGGKLGFITFGIEGGYSALDFGKLKYASNGATVTDGGIDVELVLSGPYALGMIGVSF